MKRKKTERELAKDRCDDLWSELVKIRAGFKCEVCSNPRTLNSHHVYSRANHSVRHDPENGICLCASHHMLNSKFSAHLAPADFMDWIIQKRGKEWLVALRQRANSTLTGVDYRLLALWLKNEVEHARGLYKA